MICNIPQAYRAYSPSPVMFSAAGEDKLKRILKENFPQATEIEVQDVSGGCGSMYQIYIEAEEFRGKKLVEQQRMVNSVLQAEIKGMHGLTLQTAVPSPLKNKPP
ncbi:putative BolA-like protein 3 [Hypsibius exemplaris]|uniref:BolA-like protein 3 n=1 Tax=Hypsibius exemplaris TaxID=2072580 RepID=A0A1W0WZS3_HYPEX|nr:putative BolA-like protein 3 [Hypsibius exemplaris]